MLHDTMLFRWCRSDNWSLSRFHASRTPQTPPKCVHQTLEEHQVSAGFKPYEWRSRWRYIRREILLPTNKTSRVSCDLMIFKGFASTQQQVNSRFNNLFFFVRFFFFFFWLLFVINSWISIRILIFMVYY